MSYIYEMDLTRLKIQYLCPDNCFVQMVRSCLESYNPEEPEDRRMDYECAVYTITDQYKASKKWEDLSILGIETADSLPNLVEQWRKQFILLRNGEHRSQKVDNYVEKSPEDGTDSVITA